MGFLRIKTQKRERGIKMDKNNGAIYDARKLGKPKMIILGIQHMFAMFGATILVPIITGLDISTTLLMAGLGTLLFHCITKFKVPAFLGSSFAFLGGYAAIKALAPDAVSYTHLPLPTKREAFILVGRGILIKKKRYRWKSGCHMSYECDDIV